MAKAKALLGFEPQHHSVDMVVESAQYLIDNGLVPDL